MDILERSVAMFIVFSAVEIGRSVYRGYVEKHPELNETPEQRTKRKEVERIEKALRYGLESGRLSKEEYDRLYIEKVTNQYADYSFSMKKDEEQLGPEARKEIKEECEPA